MSVAKKMFRTVVVAGAMLGTAYADPQPSKDPAKNAPVDQKAPENRDKPTDKTPTDKAPSDPAKKPGEQKPAPNKPVDKKAPTTGKDKKADASRPRGTEDRPVGRGFVLA
jgi:hypothetical protein